MQMEPELCVYAFCSLSKLYLKHQTLALTDHGLTYFEFGPKQMQQNTLSWGLSRRSVVFQKACKLRSIATV